MLVSIGFMCRHTFHWIGNYLQTQRYEFKFLQILILSVISMLPTMLPTFYVLHCFSSKHTYSINAFYELNT